MGVNSILSTRCDTWCHKRCSGLQRVVGVADFVCPACASPPPQRDDDSIILNEDTIQEVQHFCYLGDVLDRDAGVERSVRARISAAWAKWRELASLLCNRAIPVKSRAQVYSSCIRPVMCYGAETWALTNRMETLLRSTDRRMLRYLSGVRWQDNVRSQDILTRTGLMDIRGQLRQQRLRGLATQRELKKEECYAQQCSMRHPGEDLLADRGSRGGNVLRRIWMLST